MGVVHPDHLLERLTQRQLDEWLAWHSLSPIGERRNDTRMAVMTAHLRAVMIEGEDAPPSSFRPQFEIYNSHEDFDETDEDEASRQQREASQFL